MGLSYNKELSKNKKGINLSTGKNKDEKTVKKRVHTVSDFPQIHFIMNIVTSFYYI